MSKGPWSNYDRLVKIAEYEHLWDKPNELVNKLVNDGIYNSSAINKTTGNAVADRIISISTSVEFLKRLKKQFNENKNRSI